MAAKLGIEDYSTICIPLSVGDYNKFLGDGIPLAPTPTSQAQHRS